MQILCTSNHRRSIIAILCALALSIAAARRNIHGRSSELPGNPAPNALVTVDLKLPLNRFVPERDLGATLDGLEHGEVASVYTPHNEQAMKSAGLRSISYRLRTELGVEAWHWNPAGRWSDQHRRSGYWVSDADGGGSLAACYGYALPRRGDSYDQANNTGYSRLDDGDSRSFWKSNPYLDRYFTGDANSSHPQWIVIDVKHWRRVDAIRIEWRTPFAIRYIVEYGPPKRKFQPNDIATGPWTPFPAGEVLHGRGGFVSLRTELAPYPVRTIRILMTASSDTGPAGSADVRDHLGYAIGEVYAGSFDKQRVFHDYVSHSKLSRVQSAAYVSSTDSWHTSADLDKDVEQPGFDRVFRSGLTSALPMMAPAPTIYDTPENAAAEIRWLVRHKYNVKRVELGEEPDGQFISPEDYGALFIQWGRAIHAVDPAIQLGGPSLQTDVEGWGTSEDSSGNGSWVNRFITYLRRHGHLRDLAFFSFEWYPFDDVSGDVPARVRAEPALLEKIVGELHKQGVSGAIPLVISEYGYSSTACRQEVDLPEALLNCEIVGGFLRLGGAAAYLYGYEPDSLMLERAEHSDSFGNLTMWLADSYGRAAKQTPAFYAAWLLTHVWAAPASELHTLFASRITDFNGKPVQSISVYPASTRKSGLTVLFVNSSVQHAWSIRLSAVGGNSPRTSSLRATELYTYSSREYKWKADGSNGHATRNLPPAHYVWQFNQGPRSIVLPPWSIAVARYDVSHKQPVQRRQAVH